MKTAVKWTFLLAICLTMGHRAVAQSIAWQPDLRTAQQTAAQNNQLLLLHFGATWCSPCVRLERSVFTNPQVVQAINSQFVPVKLDVDQEKALCRQLGVKPIPCDVIMTASGEVVSLSVSPPTAAEYVKSISTVAVAHRSGNAPATAQAGSDTGARQASAESAGPYGQSDRCEIPEDNAPAAAQQDSRYADYYRSRQDPGYQPVVPAAPAAPTYREPAALPQTGPYSTDPNAAASSGSAAPVLGPRYGGAGQPSVGQPSAGQPSAGQVPAENAGNAGVAANYENPLGLRLPAGAAPLGLFGYCPVAATERTDWIVGDLRIGITHRGRTYLFSSMQARDKFMSDPDRFTPAYDQFDTVAAMDLGQQVRGTKDFAVLWGDRVYLFSSSQNMEVFERNTARYAIEYQQPRAANRQPAAAPRGTAPRR